MSPWAPIVGGAIGAIGGLAGGGQDVTPDIKDIEYQNRLARDQWMAETYANRPQQITPWGSQTWTPYATVDPVTGQTVTSWAQQTTLPEDLQAAVEAQQGLQRQQAEFGGGIFGNLTDAYMGAMQNWQQGGGVRDVDPTYDPSQLIDYGQPAYGSIPGMGAVPQAFGQVGPELDPSQRYYQDAEDAIYGQFERRAEPRFEQQMAATDTALRNQGLRPGDEAYDYQMQQLRQSQEDARLGAQYQATQGAGADAARMLGMDAQTRAQLNQELQQIFGQQLASGAMSDAQRAQAFGEQMTAADYQNRVRAQQLAEQGVQFGQGMSAAQIDALRRQQQTQDWTTAANQLQVPFGGAVQTPNMPQFMGVSGPDYTGAYNNAYMQNAYGQGVNAQQQQNVWGNLAQFGGAIAGLPWGQWFGGGGGGGGGGGTAPGWTY